MVDQVITKQELINAKVDAKTLEDTVNGPPDIKVTSRLGRQYWTLATIDSKVASVVSQADYALVLIQNAQDQIVEIADTAQAQFDVKMADLEGQANSTINEWQAAINTIVVNDGVPALSVSTATGEDQQEINDFGGAKWRSKAGGYKLGATVVLNNGDIVKSTVPNNIINPNVDMTGWVKTNNASQMFFKPHPSLYEISIQSKLSEIVSVQDYGAIGDGMTHTLQEWVTSGKFSNLLAIQMVYPNAAALTDYIDRVAIQKCIDDCRLSGKVANGVSGANYTIDAPVKMYSNADFSCSTFTVSPTYNNKVVRISANDLTGIDRISFLNIYLPKILNNRAVGTLPIVGSAGVFLESVIICGIKFSEIRGFETNLHLYSNDTNKYISYNYFDFSGASLRGAATNVLIEVTGSGWINECVWEGGQFAQFSQDTAAFPTRCLKIKKTSGGNNAPNGHKFNGCSMEGAYTYTIDYDYDSSIMTSFYSLNRFNDCRFEAAINFKFNTYALYDAMNNCYIPDSAVFEGGVYPDSMDGCGRFANKVIDVAAIETGSGFRTSKRTYIFQASNSASAVPLSVGFQNRLNGGIRANGNHVVYDAADETKLYPMVECGKLSGTPSINFGSGVTAPTDRIYWNAAGDLRHNAAISPSTNNTFDLGASGRGYKTLWSNNARLTQGFSVWATVPPSSKPSITGKITPTTIAEQNAVLNSIVSALVSYGLVSDDRT